MPEKEFLSVQLSSDEKRRVRRAAEVAGVTISQLVRPAIVGVADATLTAHSEARVADAVVRSVLTKLGGSDG